MTNKTIRKLHIFTKENNKHSEFLSICELFGYEVSGDMSSISILHDIHNDKIVGVLGLYAYYYKHLHKYILVKINDVHTNIHINGYTHKECNIVTFLIEESFKIIDDTFVITELQYKTIQEYSQNILQKIEIYYGDIDKRVIRRLNNIEYNKNLLCINLYEAKHNEDNIDNNIRTMLSHTGYREIFTHTIVNYNNTEKHLELTLSSNIIDRYLSHDYLRDSITISFYYEYQVYKKYVSMFEIANVFNLHDENKRDSINIFFCYKRYLHHKLKFTINNILSHYNLHSRYYFENKNKYVKYIRYVDIHKKTHTIGIHTIYNDIYCYELYCDVLKNIDTHIIEKNISYEDINCFINDTHENIEEHYNKNVKQLISEDSNIISILIIDIYKNKYTIRVERVKI